MLIENNWYCSQSCANLCNLSQNPSNVSNNSKNDHRFSGLNRLPKNYKIKKKNITEVIKEEVSLENLSKNFTESVDVLEFNEENYSKYKGNISQVNENFKNYDNES